MKPKHIIAMVAIVCSAALLLAGCVKKETIKCPPGERPYICVVWIFPADHPPGSPNALDNCKEGVKVFCARSLKRAQAILNVAIQAIVNDPSTPLDAWVKGGCEPYVEGDDPKLKPNNEEPMAILEELKGRPGRDTCSSCVSSAVAPGGGCEIPFSECEQSQACQECLSCVLAPGGSVLTCACGTASLLVTCLENACGTCTPDDAASGDDWQDGGACDAIPIESAQVEAQQGAAPMCSAGATLESGEDCTSASECISCNCAQGADAWTVCQ